MTVAFSGERSTTSGLVGPPTDNCDLTTTAIPLVNVRLLQEGLHCDKFTFIVNDKPFQIQLLKLSCYRWTFGNNLKSTLAQEGLSFAIPKLTPFSDEKLIFKSRIRNRPFCSAGNYAMLALSDFSSVCEATPLSILL
jgi:hypothetical protein